MTISNIEHKTWVYYKPFSQRQTVNFHCINGIRNQAPLERTSTIPKTYVAIRRTQNQEDILRSIHPSKHTGEVVVNNSNEKRTNYVELLLSKFGDILVRSLSPYPHFTTPPISPAHHHLYILSNSLSCLCGFFRPVVAFFHLQLVLAVRVSW